MYKKQAEYYTRSVVDAVELRSLVWDGHGLLLINALSDNAEALARAWCAEQGKHAVVRKGSDCCFACAACMTGRGGLSFNVLICTRDW